MDTEAGEQVFFEGHPSWRSLWLHMVRWTGIALVVGVIAGVASRAAESHVDALWIVGAVLVVLAIGLLIGQLRRIVTTYAITDRRLVIESGILSRDSHQTRLERIQNVNLRQTLLERLLGIGDINFDTAAEAGFQFSFNGVADPKQIVRTVNRALDALPNPAPRAGV